ncbi:tetratricopeptide repeat protein [Aquimarina agarivorans]|uniref:tetratricopeptide repeat protein n=1 Tax=Aquimarina agarivorans TaxID=980584 RepID=UPI000248EBE0|nr:tetratricopeptide repeat protein [Aquimarina agarivorans]
MLAQEVPQQSISTLNDISNVSKTFEDAFYNALSFRLIEKHQKAIDAIDECLKLDNTKPILYYEKAKNYFELKAYDLAQDNLEIALERMPKNEAILTNLQKIYFVQQKYDKTIATLRKLVEIDPKYKKSLAQAYVYTEQYGKSLEVLSSYESAFGYDTSIEKLRNRIYSVSKDKTDVIIHLEKALDRNPQNENAYVKLIEVYKGLNKHQEASKVLLRFKAAMPDSPLMDYLTFRDYLYTNDTVKATEIMKKLTSNNNISDTLKGKVLDDYRTYGKQNPNFTADLNSMESSTLSEEENMKFFMELSAFQLAQGSTESLLKVYEENLNVDSNNFSLIKDTLPLLLYYGKNKKAKELVSSAIEKYPSQPFLYLINGHLLAKEGEHKKAITSYSDGLDYIVDNPEYERALYLKMAVSYEALGAPDKAKKYQSKGEKISIE